jgi:ribosomal protein S18 acetylase RimI-like enzyme
MWQPGLQQDNPASRLSFEPARKASLKVERLTDRDKSEVLGFLAERPTRTFGMAGFIRNNGIESPHNRGTFYACRDEEGRLHGVALIGHAILFETRSEAATAALARAAQDCSDAHMLLAEQESAQTFWGYYSEKGQPVRLYCRELLFEQSRQPEPREPVEGLRFARPEDLDLIVPVHAETAFVESGIDPLKQDPEGFRKRCARRIDQGKTLVWIEGEELLFKAEIVADTPEVVYLEGVWVNPQHRGGGVGLRCLSQLNREFLQRTKSVCVLVNEKFEAAQAFYRKAGFEYGGHFDTMFLTQGIRT